MLSKALKFTTRRRKERLRPDSVEVKELLLQSPLTEVEPNPITAEGSISNLQPEPAPPKLPQRHPENRPPYYDEAHYDDLTASGPLHHHHRKPPKYHRHLHRHRGLSAGSWTGVASAARTDNQNIADMLNQVQAVKILFAENPSSALLATRFLLCLGMLVVYPMAGVHLFIMLFGLEILFSAKLQSSPPRPQRKTWIPSGEYHVRS